MPKAFIIALMITLAACEPKPSEPPTRGTVVLLHGLARSSSSMKKMQKALEEAGYNTCNISYPSTRYAISELAVHHVAPAIRSCTDSDTLHFATHSMGGILVRYMDQANLLPSIGRVVMLSPPNQGSEIVDEIGDLWLFEAVNGPAGRELGTDSSSMPMTLGPVRFELGVITGNTSYNPLLSNMIAGPDDGKVSVERARIEGMRDFMVVPATHTFIMNKKETIRQTLHFLAHGMFEKPGAKFQVPNSK